MLRYTTYQEGKVKAGEGENYGLPPKNGFLWLFASKPSETELNKLETDFALNPKITRGYIRATHSKRFSTRPFIFVFTDYFLDKGQVTQTKILFILEKNYLIMLVPQEYGYYNELFDNINQELKKKNGGRDISYILYRFLEEDTEENYDVLEKTESKIVELETRLVQELKPHPRLEVGEIIKLKRQLFSMSRRFWASAKIIFAIKKGLTPLTLKPEALSLFDDIYNTFQHQLDMATAQKEMLSDALEIYATTVSNNLANISNNLNKVMKTLTSLTVIIIVPSLIAGIFGMNFKHMPLTDWPSGFLILNGFMLAIMLAFGIYFYKKDWF